MSTMSKDGRETFLAGVHVAAFSVARPDGPPLMVPVWYQYEPGGEVRVQTGPGTLKYQLARAAGEFSLLVQNDTPPYRYVSVSGPIVAIDPETSRADVESMARRYLDGEALVSYLKMKESQAPMATLRMRPERWRSTDFS